MKGSSRPIAVDLFAGAGGLSLGFEQAGFDVVAAVELDPVHAAVHAFNFPECAVLPRSVVGLSASEIRAAAKIGDRKVDVVIGGAPCQGFSLIGHRALDDPRNRLVGEFVRIVQELDADYFVFENVKGLTVGKHKKFLQEVIDAFEAIGYRVRNPWQILNASQFGVPQDRERLFLLGAKTNKPLPKYPRPTIRPGKPSDLLDSLRSPTCHDALSDLPDAEQFLELLESDKVHNVAWGEPTPYARRLRCLDNDSWLFGYPRNWDPNILTSSIRTNHSDISRGRFLETEQGTVEPISRFYKLAPTGVSNTLRAGTDSARGAFTSPRPIHYKFARCVTVREMARLHGFPDWFRFHRTKWHGARQIGNSVPPPLAFAVASEVVRSIGFHPKKIDIACNLGGENLLQMDVSEAARHWKIEAPFGRRDRKSGAKKRKQEEIEATRDRFENQLAGD